MREEWIMVYVMSDIHGCYREFLELLELIAFSEQDELYVLGDMVDRGPSPIPLLLDLMARPNVYPLLGNHDYMALTVLKKLNVEITEENFESHLSEDDLMNYMYWMEDGGSTTMNQFARLDEEKREAILEYLEDCSVLEEIGVEGRRYILVHADLAGYEACLEENVNTPPPDIMKLEGCTLADLLFHRADYAKRYFREKDTFVVTGHTPTFGIRTDEKPLVYEGNGHIAIDCGCVFGGTLAAYRLNDHEAFYVEKSGED